MLCMGYGLHGSCRTTTQGEAVFHSDHQHFSLLLFAASLMQSTWASVTTNFTNA